jgi:hypothetical protein
LEFPIFIAQLGKLLNAIELVCDLTQLLVAHPRFKPVKLFAGFSKLTLVTSCRLPPFEIAFGLQVVPLYLC